MSRPWVNAAIAALEAEWRPDFRGHHEDRPVVGLGRGRGARQDAGQPQQSGDVRYCTDLRAERAKALYSEDAGMSLRKSHENPVIKELYESYLGKPGSHKAHEILHTSYVARKVY